jgi:hypothetical protein
MTAADIMYNEHQQSIEAYLASFQWSPVNHSSFGRAFRMAVAQLFRLSVVPDTLLARLPLEMLYLIVDHLATQVRNACGRWRTTPGQEIVPLSDDDEDVDIEQRHQQFEAAATMTINDNAQLDRDCQQRDDEHDTNVGSQTLLQSAHQPTSTSTSTLSIRSYWQWLQQITNKFVACCWYSRPTALPLLSGTVALLLLSALPLLYYTRK